MQMETVTLHQYLVMAKVRCEWEVSRVTSHYITSTSQSHHTDTVQYSQNHKHTSMQPLIIKYIKTARNSTVAT